MKKGLLYIFLLTSVTLFGQMEVGSHWKATGNTASGLENLGFDSTKVHFLAAGVFEISYIQSGTLYTETSTWQDLSSNQVNVTYDPNGNFFGMMCPTSNNTFNYSISSNLMTLTNIQGTCTSAYSVLSNSTWQKIGGTSSASLTTNSAKHIELFPIPANDFLIIKSDEELLDKSLVILNALGSVEKVGTERISASEIQLNISHLASGVYFVQLKSGTFLRFVVK